MSDWMKRLREHYERTRERCPEHPVLVLFDVDGTILDLRPMVLRTLRQYDEARGTDHFSDLTLEDVRIHENLVDRLPRLRDLPTGERDAVRDWYLARRWTPESIFTSHRPYEGVMEVIRWFQLQPRTHVGLNTGRPEALRTETLFSLNVLGEEYKVEFSDDLLFMRDPDRGLDVPSSKVEGVRHFRSIGYVVCAFVDNEPVNLEAIASMEESEEILLLHADRLFESRRDRLPPGSVSGEDYRIAELVPTGRLPRHVRFVWHGLNTPGSLERFLDSNVSWGEMDVRWDPGGRVPVLRRRSFEERRPEDEAPLFLLEEALPVLYESGKMAKLDLKSGGRLIARVVELAQEVGISSARLWINGRPEHLGEVGFRRLRRAFPLASLQCPVDDLVREVLAGSSDVERRVDEFREWGIDRLSVRWDTPMLRFVLDQLEDWGFATNVYGAPDLDSFLRCVLLQPSSITVNFGFSGGERFSRAGEETADDSASSRSDGLVGSRRPPFAPDRPSPRGM